jgi:hypothetical protein
MSKKHNTKHESRGQSNYGDRLRARGMTSAKVRMKDYVGVEKENANKDQHGKAGRVARAAQRAAA